MKIVKLFLIVAVIGSIFYGLLSISDNTGKGHGPININGDSKDLYGDFSDTINQYLNNESLWEDSDSIVYMKIKTKMDVYEKNINGQRNGGYDELINNINNTVCKKLYSSLNSNLKKQSCTLSEIEKTANGIDFILKMDKNLMSDKRIKESNEKIQLFKKIMEFGNKSMYKKTNFSPVCNWYDFETFKNNKIDTMKSLKNNKYFKELSSITQISQSIENFDNNLYNAQESFYNKLACEIMGYYTSTERNTSNLENFRRAVMEYNRKSKINNEKLQNQFKSFEKEVEQLNRN